MSSVAKCSSAPIAHYLDRGNAFALHDCHTQHVTGRLKTTSGCSPSLKAVKTMSCRLQKVRRHDSGMVPIPCPDSRLILTRLRNVV